MNRYDKDHELFISLLNKIDEVFVGTRKGIAQSYYVGEIRVDDEYYCEDKHALVLVPKELVGTWKMSHPTDLTQESFISAVGRYTWYKCKKVAVTTYQYVDEDPF